MPERRQPSLSRVNPLAFWAGAVLLFLAPLIRGGNRHVALLVLEWLGLAVLLAMGAGLPRRQVPGTGQPLLSRPVGVLLLAPLWVALWQLLPLPPGLWAALPGHALYREALQAVGGSAGAWRAASLTPQATWVSVLAGLPLVAAFLLAHLCSRQQLGWLLKLLIAMAGLQAVVGLLQVGGVKWLYFDAQFAGSVIGTFANRNHFANFIAMTLPLVVMEWRLPGHGPAAEGSRARALPGGHGERSAGALWGVCLFVLLAAVAASLSRAGLATAVLVTLLAVLLMPWQALEQRRHPVWRWGGVAALLLLAVAAVGLEGVSRFVDSAAAGDVAFRWELTASTWRAALAFLPFGSGLGSYAAVYPRFQPPEVRGFAEHAHNDYVQLLMECGLLAVALAVLLAWQVARAVRELLRQVRVSGRLHRGARLRLCCGLGLLALVLHSWVDFNLRIPANAMLGAFLLGVLVRPLAVAGRGDETVLGE